jgi:hypothetical protein
VHHLEFPISRQPDDWTCGPACLQSVYRYYGDEISQEQVIAEVPQLELGGTLAVLLACHALRRGYKALIFTYNLRLFDPTWFTGVEGGLRERLIAQMAAKEDAKLKFAARAYLDFLELGGKLRLEDLTRSLLRHYLNQGEPILTGLSATWLYRCSREVGRPSRFDDVAGLPVGHFVVLCGYEKEGRSVRIADPLHPNPLSTEHYYTVGIDRLVGAILLGILTYDANLLIITPPVPQSKIPTHVNSDSRQLPG